MNKYIEDLKEAYEQLTAQERKQLIKELEYDRNKLAYRLREKETLIAILKRKEE